MINTTAAATSSTGTQFPTTAASNANGGVYSMQPSDFIKLMVTQLQNQDPTQPASNADLMAQMSDIGQLEASSDMQSTLKAVTLQTQIGSASALIGKSVTGIDANNKTVTGNVTSIGVAGGSVTLSLDTGGSLPLASVATITSPTGTTTPTTN